MGLARNELRSGHASASGQGQDIERLHFASPAGEAFSDMPAPAPLWSPLPLREGARGRGLRASARRCAEDRPCRQIRIAGIQAALGCENPLPLPPSREGRGDSLLAFG